MSITKSAFLAASLVVAATGAQAQSTTYIGGPKSGLTQTVHVAGAKPIGSDHAYSSYAQAIQVRPRVLLPRTGFSGGVRAIGVDSASYEPAVRQRVFQAVPAPSYGASAPTSGAKAIASGAQPVWGRKR